MLLIDLTNIENLIYEIRGNYVMLDKDLAELYHCKNGTKSINLAVKRHINRFPERYMFRLTEEECSRFQFETLNISRGNNIKYLPYAFTEQGVAMLATVLRTEVAEKISIQIMDAFVAMKKYLSTNLLEQRNIYSQVLKNTEDIKLLQESFKKFEEKKVVNEIYFKGQIYDAYSKILDIVQEAEEELIVIDGYADKTLLDIIRRVKCNVILITRANGCMSRLDIDKYNKQYKNLKVVFSNSFHDRYFIVDRGGVYHCGTSINYAGSRTFSINILEDKVVRKNLINNAVSIIRN